MSPFLLLLALAVLPAQHEQRAASTATLLPGLGHTHHQIATGSAEAQKFFDQGLTLVYGFNHDEAIRSFRRAAALDPASPMPLWGVALALGPNINLDVDPAREQEAYETAQQALKLAAGAPAAERAYAAALVKRYSNDPKADLKALAVGYKDAMRDLSRQYPDDLDAATLYAESLMDLHPWKLWSNDGKPEEGTETLVAVLESVLRRDPLHVGANHYYIHALEASPWPEHALASASRLETLVPLAGHLVHMPSHVYMRTGDYFSALVSNIRAATVDREYFAATNADGVYPLMYYNHNLDFIASAAMMTGQLTEADRAAQQLVQQITPALPDMPMLQPFAAKPLYVWLRFAKWDNVLALLRPEPKMGILTVLWHFGRSVAFAKKGQTADAERERAAFREAGRIIPRETPWNYNSTGDMLQVMDAVLDGRIALANGDSPGAVEAFTRAVAAEDSLSYDEPPDWYYPVRESLGAVLLGASRFAEAERVFREDLQRNPRNGRSLFGLWQTLILRGNDSGAARLETEFKEAWKHAEVQLKLADF
jgi:tetratricopeptide (TPR) repeat protein